MESDKDNSIQEEASQATAGTEQPVAEADSEQVKGGVAGFYRAYLGRENS